MSESLMTDQEAWLADVASRLNDLNNRSQTADVLDRCRHTLVAWEKEGTLVPRVRARGRVYYTRGQILEFLRAS